MAGFFFDNAGEADAAAYQIANPAPQDDPTITPDMTIAAIVDGATENSPSTPLNGDANMLPLVTDTMQSTIRTAYSGLQNLLGVVGTAVRGFGGGAGVGPVPVVKTVVNTAPAPRTKVGQWWATSSGSDKLVVFAAIAGIYLAVKG